MCCSARALGRALGARDAGARSRPSQAGVFVRATLTLTPVTFKGHSGRSPDLPGAGARLHLEFLSCHLRKVCPGGARRRLRGPSATADSTDTTLVPSPLVPGPLGSKGLRRASFSRRLAAASGCACCLLLLLLYKRCCCCAGAAAACRCGRRAGRARSARRSAARRAARGRGQEKVPPCASERAVQRSAGGGVRCRTLVGEGCGRGRAPFGRGARTRW